jgi:hypothetical protein
MWLFCLFQLLMARFLKVPEFEEILIAIVGVKKQERKK